MDTEKKYIRVRRVHGPLWNKNSMDPYGNYSIEGPWILMEIIPWTVMEIIP